MREIELKFRINLSSDTAIDQLLREKGVVVEKEKYQHDIVMLLPSEIGHKLIKGSKVLRLRTEKKNNQERKLITLKVLGEHQMETQEYEYETNDVPMAVQVFQRLGFQIDVEIKKTRKEGALGKYNFCLDSVEKLGTFIELELLTEDETISAEQVQKEMQADLTSIGLNGEITTITYDAMIRLLNATP